MFNSNFKTIWILENLIELQLTKSIRIKLSNQHFNYKPSRYKQSILTSQCKKQFDNFESLIYFLIAIKILIYKILNKQPCLKDRNPSPFVRSTFQSEEFF